MRDAATSEDSATRDQLPRDDLWLRRLPDSERAFTLCQVAQVIGVDYDVVHRAQLALSYRASTREAMRPLDNEAPRHYSPLAARLIARHVTAPTVRELRERAQVLGG